MGRRARIAALAAGVLAIAAAFAVATALAAGPAGGKKQSANLFAGVNFVSACAFSHEAMDDPIVYPGQPGKSHDHSFVGNTSTDASSTLASLQAAGTTCRRPADKAGYWMPTLLVDGNAVTLGQMAVLAPWTSVRVEARAASKLVLLGGARMDGDRLIWWNFVATDPEGVVVRYKATAVPVLPGKTGVRAFCTDQTGELRFGVNDSPETCRPL